jgi:hypothetical protein
MVQDRFCGWAAQAASPRGIQCRCTPDIYPRSASRLAVSLNLSGCAARPRGGVGATVQHADARTGRADDPAAPLGRFDSDDHAHNMKPRLPRGRTYTARPYRIGFRRNPGPDFFRKQKSLTTRDSRGSGQFAKRRDDLFQAVGLWHKATAFRQVVFVDVDEAGGCDDFDRWPAAPNKSGELQAIH